MVSMSKELLYNQLYEKTKGFGRNEFIKELMRLERENQQLKEQLEYLRSGEYLNQVKFERNMLQDLVDEEKLSTEVYDIKKIMSKNTELAEKLQQREEVIEEAINKIEDLRMEKWAIMGTDIMDLLDILNKYKKYGY